MNKLKELLTRLENSRFAPLVQFIKFGLVGVSNTLISYAVEMLCYYVLFTGHAMADNVRILVSNIIAFFISVTNSYYWNNRFVFQNGERRGFRRHAAAYGKTVLCYGVTGLLLAPALKMWISDLGVVYWLASLSTLIVTIPLNFVLNKFWAFRK